jgi:gliding motility-associated-like protein
MNKTNFSILKLIKPLLRFRLKLSLLILMVGGVGNLLRPLAQIDTAFWFAAPNISSSIGDNPIYLRLLTYHTPATVTISQPANIGFTPIIISIPANQVDSVNLSPFLANIESPAANVVSDNGIKISSSSPINAYYEVRASTNREVFSLKGAKGLGTTFYTPFQKFWNSGTTTPASFSSIEIVASEDNTTVLLTPRAAIVGHSANVSFSIILNKGQTYSARDIDGIASTSLAGSIVSSNKPISVTIHEGGLTNIGCLSTLGDQLTTSDFAGTDFIIQKSTATNERVYILATQNGTNLTISNSGTVSSLINWSETYQYALNQGVNYIKTNKPVYVLHVSGNGCNLSMAQVPNVLCAGTYNTAFTRTASDSLGVILYTRSGFENQFTLNGNTSLIDPAQFQIVPGTSGAYKVGLFYFNTSDVPINSYNEVTNTGDIFGLGVISGSHSQGSSYAYFSEFNSYPFVEAGADASSCANVPFDLNGLVGGGSVTGIWSSNGFGSFSTDLTALTTSYLPSPLDTIISPITIILSSTGPCPVQRDTLQLVVTPSPIVNASVDQIVCENNALVQLNGNVFGGANTGIWTTLGTGTFSPINTDLQAIYTPSATDISNGQVKLALTATNFGSCAAISDTMIINITVAATVDAGPSTVSVCSNNPQVNLTGTVSGSSTSGKWITTGNGVFSPNNLSLNCTYNPSVNDLQNGWVKLYLESTANGTCVAVRDSVTITFTAPPIVDAGEAIIACTNLPSINLSGLVSGITTTGIWSGGLGTFQASTTQLNAMYTPSPLEIANGNLFLTLSSTNNEGCNAVTDNVQIIFVAPPFANFNYNEVCHENTTIFTDFSLPGYGSISDWHWDFGDGTSSVNQNVSFNYANPGNYQVSLVVTTNVGCSDTSTHTVNVFPLPIANFDYTISCNSNQILVDFNDLSVVNNDIITSWFYDFGGQGAISAQHPTQLFIGSGNFVITQIVSTSNGCVDTTIQVMTITPRPDAGFFYNTSNGLNIGALFNFIDTSYHATSYIWSFGDGNTSIESSPSYTYFENGNYIVTLNITGDYGCVDSAQALISINTIVSEIVQLIPNAISPNGDGKNDHWELDFLNLLYPAARVEIYNRWGQQIFFTEGLYTPWDGNHHGEPAPDGTYYYVITLNDAANTPPFKGALLVLRNRK